MFARWCPFLCKLLIDMAVVYQDSLPFDEKAKQIAQENRTKRLLAFMEKTGLTIIQTNGQRITVSLLKDVPPKGSEVFIGKIPQDIFEDELVPLFNQAGKIYEFRLMMNFSELNRGYGFARFTSPEEARLAVKMFNNFEVRIGRPLGVQISRDNCRLYVGNLPHDKSTEDIKFNIVNMIDGVTDVIVYGSHDDKSRHRGFAFVDFQNHRIAALARRRLPNDFAKILGKGVTMDWATPEIEPSWEVMSKVKTIFVRNLTYDTDEAFLLKIFNVDGAVEKVKKCRDFAFIHFNRREAAQDAIRRWDGMPMKSSVLSVMWAKPVNRLEYLSRKMELHNQRVAERLLKDAKPINPSGKGNQSPWPMKHWGVETSDFPSYHLRETKSNVWTTPASEMQLQGQGQMGYEGFTGAVAQGYNVRDTNVRQFEMGYGPCGPEFGTFGSGFISRGSTYYNSFDVGFVPPRVDFEQLVGYPPSRGNFAREPMFPNLSQH